MAVSFPLLFSEGFEAGSAGNFDGETDTDSKLNFRHAKDMFHLVGEAPYRGAYAAHVNLAGGTADAYLNETVAVAANGDVSVRFYVYFSGFVMAASDRFSIFRWLDAAAANVEADIGIRNNAGTLEWVVSEAGVGTNVTLALVQDRWHKVELVCNVDAGGGNDGTIAFFLNDGQVGATITALDQNAFDSFRIGSIGIDAGTTAGHIFFDEIAVDDVSTRIDDIERFPRTEWVIHAQHVVLGPGKVNVSLTGTGTNAVLTIYDTYDANARRMAGPIRVIRNLTANEFVGPMDAIEFVRGCYMTITGTNAQAFVDIEEAYTQSAARRRAWAAGI